MGTNKRYPSDRGPESTQRHCWVLRTRDRRGPFPGLILEWRRTNSRDWQARVVYVPDDQRSVAIEEWFAAQLLRPIDSWPSDRIRADAKTV